MRRERDRAVIRPREDVAAARGAAAPSIVPVLITGAVFLLAVAFGWAMWDVYMEAPWTRDGTVRAYVVTMAPEVVGRIVELPVADNQFVHKGDLLMVIDPTDYKIAVKLAEAAVQQAQVSAQNLQRESTRRQELTNLAVTVEEQQTYAANAVAGKAKYLQTQANLDQARVNLERTEIRSPVNGFVTNLLARLGDYANVGQTEIPWSTPIRSGSTGTSRRRISVRSTKATPQRSS